ncbi:hypothetical protein TWF225_000396 [Orbilia oligospora]|nr:hypothetical protein TWF225_000396 [Orbilia oligospora]KAF3254131.1 hypothetical protein TWF128_006259 [Orbilia oligospora]KAF3272041.1 hypothetical protein TWF217_003857 [Orbilia oligospora]KAF3297793.1 hypothetical protein TWF132_006189 [Orbilia oligospora]
MVFAILKSEMGKHGQQVSAIPYATTFERSPTNRSPSLNSLGIHQHLLAFVVVCHRSSSLVSIIIIRQYLPAFVIMRRSLAAPILGVSSCHLSQLAWKELTHCDLFGPLDLNKSVEPTISVAQPSQSIKAYAGLLEPIDSPYDYEDQELEHLFQSYLPDTCNSGQQEFYIDDNEPPTSSEDRASALRFVTPDSSAGRGFLINDRDNELPSSPGPAITHPDNHIFAPYLLSPVSITPDSSQLPPQNSRSPAWEIVQELSLPMTRLNQKKISKKRQREYMKSTKPKIGRRSSAEIQEATLRLARIQKKQTKKEAEKRSSNRPNKYFFC